MTCSILKARKSGAFLCIVLAVSLGNAFAAPRLETTADNDDWWADRAGVFFPRYQFTLMSTSDLAARTLDTPSPNAPDATKIWNTTAGSADWLAAGSWSGGVPGTSDIGSFDGTKNPSDGKVGFTAGTAFGAISLSNTSSSITFGSIGNGGSRQITLNGTTVNGIANTILSNTTTAATTLTIIPQISVNKTLSLTLGNTTNVIQASSGDTIDLQVGLDQATAGSTLTFQGGGTLILNDPSTYTGLTTVTAGTLREGVSNAILTGGLTVNGSTAIFDLGASHSDSVGTVTVAGGGSITGTGTSTLTTTGSFEMQSGSVSAILAGSTRTLNKTTGGTVTLSGANTYTGATTVSGGGKLLINGNQSSATGAVAVNNSGTILGGTGTIGGKVTVASGAILLGGTGATASGTLTVSNTSSGAITLQSGSIIELALGSSHTHSTIAHTGSGTISFSSTQAFTFIDLGAPTGFYDNIITGTGLGSLTTSGWTITNSGWSGSFLLDGSGNIDLTLTAVPEPGTWAVGVLALLAVGYTQRRRFVRKPSFARVS